MKIFFRAKSLYKWMMRHKFIAIIIIAILVLAGYFGIRTMSSQNQGEISYTTAIVEKGTLITTVSGTGQIAVSNQADIKPRVSGDIVSVSVKNGDEVKAGTLLFKIDTSDAEKAVRDAETSLETAKLDLQELSNPPDELTLLKAENDLLSTKESIPKDEENILNAYEDGFNDVANVFLDLPTIITDTENVLYGQELADNEPDVSGGNDNVHGLINSIPSQYIDERTEFLTFTDKAEEAYSAVRQKYDDNLSSYRAANRLSDQETIDALLDETIQTIRAMSETIKSEINMLDYWVDFRTKKGLRIFSDVTAYQTELKSYISKVNSHLSTLLSVQRSIQSAKDTIVSAERSIKEKELSLENLKAGADALEIRAKEIAVQQKKDALTDAKKTLDNCYVRAPFDGIIIEANASKGQSVSSGTVLASIITKQKLAEITLNEVDVSQLALGQKATITLDAIEEMTLTGEVADIDTLGTVSQGVVSYDVKIALDTQEDKIKPNMSISAEIMTNIKQGVLLVPNSAVKYQGEQQYVEIMSSDGTISRKAVEAGLSNDTMTEITSGLNEGDEVIIQTSASSSNNSSTGTSNGFSAGAGGGEMMRIMR
ncbi:efflux RND transporter periplasmic adaptor subunit [Patescibacteria group bacterium]|nr:efflux RND transporter periplasmic adaptor subunit [Patescibacteria group bacterium]